MCITSRQSAVAVRLLRCVARGRSQAAASGQQAALLRLGVPATSRFRIPLYYKFVRPLIYLGFIIASGAAATVTVEHPLLTAVTTAYIVVGILLKKPGVIGLGVPSCRETGNFCSAHGTHTKSAGPRSVGGGG
jgi:hypothetical protein